MSESVSPSASVTVQVYTVRSITIAGMPLTRWLAAITTSFGKSLLRLYLSVPLPPLASGRVNGAICAFRAHHWSAIFVPSGNTGAVSSSKRAVTVRLRSIVTVYSLPSLLAKPPLSPQTAT